MSVFTLYSLNKAVTRQTCWLLFYDIRSVWSVIYHTGQNKRVKGKDVSLLYWQPGNLSRNPLQLRDHSYVSSVLEVMGFDVPKLMVLCCFCAHFHGLGSAVQTPPLLIHGAAEGLLGKNSAEGQVVMNGLPSASLSSLCPVLPGGLVGLAAGCVLVIGPLCFWPLTKTSSGKESERVSYCGY